MEQQKRATGYSHPVSGTFYKERKADKKFLVNNANTMASVNGPIFTGVEYKLGSPRSPKQN